MKNKHYKKFTKKYKHSSEKVRAGSECTLIGTEPDDLPEGILLVTNERIVFFQKNHS